MADAPRSPPVSSKRELEQFGPAGQRVLPGAAPAQLALDGSAVAPPPLTELLDVAAKAKPAPREQLRLDVPDPPALAPLLELAAAAQPPPARVVDFTPREPAPKKRRRRRRRQLSAEKSWAERRDDARASRRAERVRRHKSSTEERVVAALKGIPNRTAWGVHSAAVEMPMELARRALSAAHGEEMDPETGELGPRMSLGASRARGMIACVRALQIASRPAPQCRGWRITTGWGIDRIAGVLPPSAKTGEPVHRNTLCGTLHRGEPDGDEWKTGRNGWLKALEQRGCFEMRQPMEGPDGMAPASLPPDEVGPSGHAFIQFWWPPWLFDVLPRDWSKSEHADAFEAAAAAERQRQADRDAGARAPPSSPTA